MSNTPQSASREAGSYPLSAVARLAHKPVYAYVAIAALVVAGVVVWGAARATTPAPTAAAAQRTAQDSVPTFVARTLQAQGSYTTTGIVEPVHQATLAAQVGGRITKLHVAVGDAVVAGQVLATIDARTTQAGVAQANAQTEQALANYKRVQALREQGFLSVAAVDAAKAQWLVAQAGQTQASAANGFTRITAPFAGIVQTTHQTTGDVAMPGVPVITMYAPAPLRVAVQLPLSQHTALADDASPSAYMASGQALAVGAVTHASAADAMSQTVLWRLNVVGGQADQLLAGQTVEVRFASAAATQLQVPRQALVQRGDMTAVYVATPGASTTFALRAVRIAPNSGAPDMVGVLAGLRAGEQVALQPLRAAQGAPVGAAVNRAN
jgi:RND family efflux transporter MFP subunit